MNTTADLWMQLVELTRSAPLPAYTIRVRNRTIRYNDIQDLARQLYVEAQAAEADVWKALAQYGGRITADYVQYQPKPGITRWRIAGEFADLPKRLLARPGHLNPNCTRINGNLDQIANAAGMPEQDFKDFLSAHPRKTTFAEALRQAREYAAEQS